MTPDNLGKWLIWVGLGVALLGLLTLLLGRFGLFRLPGDFEFSGRNWKVYFPLASCILLSIILTLLIWLINWFRR